jgi:hypothetical protein
MYILTSQTDQVGEMCESGEKEENCSKLLLICKDISFSGDVLLFVSVWL